MILAAIYAQYITTHIFTNKPLLNYTLANVQLHKNIFYITEKQLHTKCLVEEPPFYYTLLTGNFVYLLDICFTIALKTFMFTFVHILHILFTPCTYFLIFVHKVNILFTLYIFYLHYAHFVHIVYTLCSYLFPLYTFCSYLL